MTGMIVERYNDENVFDGHFKVVRRVLTVDTPDGPKTFTRDVVHITDVVVVLPITKDGLVMALNQYRAPLNRWNTELPAGGIDGSETPIDAAVRELREEVSLESDNWKFLGEFSSSEGYSTERAYLYAALDCYEVENDFVGKDEEASMTRVLLDPSSNLRFNGAKGQLAYELGRKYL